MPVPETIDLAPWLVVLVGGTVIPLVVGLLTKQAAHPGLKAAVALALIAALAIVEPIVQTGHVEVHEFVAVFTGTFVMHVASYYGFWRPVGGGTSPTQAATPEFGLGPKQVAVAA